MKVNVFIAVFKNLQNSEHCNGSWSFLEQAANEKKKNSFVDDRSTKYHLKPFSEKAMLEDLIVSLRTLIRGAFIMFLLSKLMQIWTIL